MSRGRSSSSSRGSSSSNRGSSSSSYSRGGSSRGSSYRNSTVIIHSGNSGGYYHNYSHSSTHSKVAIVVLLILFGIIPLFFGFNFLSERLKYKSVTGTAIDNYYDGEWYFTTYEYYVNGQYYKSRSDVGWEIAETEGKQVTIYYLKNAPMSITDEEPGNVGMGIILIIIGGVFVSSGIGIASSMKKKETEPATTATEETMDETPQTPQLTGKVKCPYCGTKYKSENTSCPSCGAANRH